MTERIATHVHIDQENASIRGLNRATTKTTTAPAVRRGALGDLGNKIHSLANETVKGSVMGPPGALAKKKADPVKKSVAVVNKENNVALKNTAKENTKIAGRRAVRQESILMIPKPAANKTSKTITTTASNRVSSSTIIEQTKELLIYDPDKDGKEDPQLVAEYVQDIMAYLKQIENDFPIKEKFLEESKVTWKMRAMLVNWLVEAHQNFSMGLESLYLCISIVDRYIQANKAVDRTVYQLVGAAALLLAAKYEEIYIPDLEDFVFICDDAFTKKEILRMELDIVKKLDFRMGWPVAIYFLRRYNKIACVTSDQHTLAKYILELALLDYPLASVKSSLQAAAACCLSISILAEIMDPARCWTPTLMHYTKYKYSDFKPVVIQFAHMLVKAETSKYDSVRQKYSNTKYSQISLNFKLQGPLIRKLTLGPV